MAIRHAVSFLRNDHIWSHTMRGQLWQALAANVGGVLLAVVAVIVVAWCSVSAVRGRMATRLPSDKVLAIAAVAIAAITLADWAVRLATT